MSRRLVVELATLAIAAFAAFLIRSFVAAPYSIPSESMLPTLMVDDTLIAEKWRVGPLRRVLAFAGRTVPALPERGDVVVFRAPPSGRQAYVKRLIGLPGDRVAVKEGIVILNGAPIPRWRIADFVTPVTPNSPCRSEPGVRVELEQENGRPVCRYPRYAEMLPNGRTYAVLDITDGDADDIPERTVPAGGQSRSFGRQPFPGARRRRRRAGAGRKCDRPRANYHRFDGRQLALDGPVHMARRDTP
jgi:signal peptidase I